MIRIVANIRPSLEDYFSRITIVRMYSRQMKVILIVIFISECESLDMTVHCMSNSSNVMTISDRSMWHAFCTLTL